MARKLSVRERNIIAKKNRETLLSFDVLIWISVLFLIGVMIKETKYWEFGWGYMIVTIEIVTILLSSTNKIIELSFFRLSTIEPLMVGMIILIINKIITLLF